MVAVIEDIRDQDPLDQIGKMKVGTVIIDEAMTDEVKVVDVVKADVAIDMMIEEGTIVTIEEMTTSVLKVAAAAAAEETMITVDEVKVEEGTVMIAMIEEARIKNLVITTMINDVNILAEEDLGHPETLLPLTVDQVGHTIPLHLQDTTPQDRNIEVVKEVRRMIKVTEAIETKEINPEKEAVKGAKEEDKIEDSRKMMVASLRVVSLFIF